MDPLEFKAKLYSAGPWNCVEDVRCIGPLTLASVGDGSYQALFGALWRLTWDRKRGLILQQKQGAHFVEVAPDAPLPELPKQARKVGLAFDQAARPVVSYQIDESIYIRQWNPLNAAYEYQTLTGTDPVILMDVAVHRRSEDSDVMVWFLSLDRLSLFSALQRDSYQSPIQRAVLSGPAWLDQVVALPYVVQVGLHDHQGTEVLLLSPPYTVHVADTLTAQANVAGGEWDTILFSVTVQHQITAQASVTGGEWVINNYNFAVLHEITAGATVTGGVFDTVLITSVVQDTVTAQASVTGGALDAVGIPYGPIQDTITAQVAITGGTWT